MNNANAATGFELIIDLPARDGLDEVARSNREALINYYRARQAGDPDAFARLVDPDLHFIQSPGLPYGGEARGAEATQALMTRMFGTWSALRVEVQEVTASGDLVIAYVMLTATARATGKSYTGPTAELFRFRDGKVVEWRPIYWDTHAVREACTPP